MPDTLSVPKLTAKQKRHVAAVKRDAQEENRHASAEAKRKEARRAAAAKAELAEIEVEEAKLRERREKLRKAFKPRTVT